MDLAQRLAERAVCEAQHRPLMKPDVGLGWTGVWCPQCGFRFFEVVFDDEPSPSPRGD